MGARTHALRLMSVAAIAGAGLVVWLALAAGSLNIGATLLSVGLVLIGVLLLQAQRNRYVGRHRRA